MTRSSKPESLLRHERDCRVCHHAKREEIEQDFIAWKSPIDTAALYKIPTRSIYRHAHALGLFSRRNRNIRAALGQIIEHAGRVHVNAQAVVSAVAVLAKLNAAGQWIDRRELVSLNSLFERMSQKELETYARDGTLPQWFERTVSGGHLQSAAETED
jgi:hypothetical protein